MSFTQIKTSKENRDVVAQLTRKLSLGKENTIARMAFSYSLSKDRKLDLNDIKDFGGKEYSKSVLFGDNYDVYIGLLCTHYGFYKTDKDIGKYVKMHIDDGLELLDKEIKETGLNGFDFLSKEILSSLEMVE
jgi:DNA sulfur modification protein DndE